MITRRALLPLIGVGLPGCAGLAFDTDARPAPTVSPQSGALTVIVFEHVENRIPFHVALIVAGPQGRALYDPGGFWRGAAPDRRRDVTLNLTPDREAAYLRRDYFGDAPGTWLVHRFETAIPDAAASELTARALDMPPMPFGSCALVSAGLLRILPGWQDAPLRVLPQALLNYLRRRDDLDYRQWLTP